MIQHDIDNSHVSSTLSTEYVEISSTPLEREQGYSISTTRASPELRRISQLCTEIKKLREQVASVTAHNQSLQHCWASAIRNHTDSEAQTRAWISRAAFKDSEIGELRRRVLELEQRGSLMGSATPIELPYLNPVEESH